MDMCVDVCAWVCMDVCVDVCALGRASLVAQMVKTALGGHPLQEAFPDIQTGLRTHFDHELPLHLTLGPSLL